MKTLSVLLCFIACMVVPGCSTLTLAPAHFEWPVESVLPVDAKGMVEETRSFISFNVKPLLFEETADSTHVSGIEIHVIRDMNGYYYMAASKFKNVLVAETGIQSPAFNKGDPFIHCRIAKDKWILLSKHGIEQGGQK
jgi:hypothetical protein